MDNEALGDFLVIVLLFVPFYLFLRYLTGGQTHAIIEVDRRPYAPQFKRIHWDLTPREETTMAKKIASAVPQSPKKAASGIAASKPVNQSKVVALKPAVVELNPEDPEDIDKATRPFIKREIPLTSLPEEYHEVMQQLYAERQMYNEKEKEFDTKRRDTDQTIQSFLDTAGYTIINMPDGRNLQKLWGRSAPTIDGKLLQQKLIEAGIDPAVVAECVNASTKPGTAYYYVTITGKGEPEDDGQPAWKRRRG